MSLSPFDSFQSRFVTYLLNFPHTCGFVIATFSVLSHIKSVHGSHPIALSLTSISSSHLPLGFPSGSHTSLVSTVKIYTFLVSYVNDMRSARLILLNFITPNIIYEEKKSCSSSICNFFWFPPSFFQKSSSTYYSSTALLINLMCVCPCIVAYA